MTKDILISFLINNYFSFEWPKPVQNNNESPEERYEEAEVAVTPDPDGVGEEHNTDGGDVGEAVEEDHPVHQGVLLHLEHEEHQGIDQQYSESAGYGWNKIKEGYFPIEIYINKFLNIEVKMYPTPIYKRCNICVVLFSGHS